VQTAFVSLSFFLLHIPTVRAERGRGYVCEEKKENLREERGKGKGLFDPSVRDFLQ